MKSGFYVEVIDTINRRSEYVECSSKEEAIKECEKHKRANAHEWAKFDHNLGNYDFTFYEQWQ